MEFTIIFMQLEYCKIYSDDTLLRNFIPAYNAITESAGLYDKVEGKFYGNSGTGSFISGLEKCN